MTADLDTIKMQFYSFIRAASSECSKIFDFLVQAGTGLLAVIKTQSDFYSTFLLFIPAS
jgi:hypothetical protein